MKNLHLLLFILACAEMQSCSIHIHSDLAAGTDFKKHKSFALLPDADTVHSKMRLSHEVIRSISSDAADEMKIRGFVLDTLHPDLLVLVHVFLKQVNDTFKTPIFSSYPYSYPGIYIGPWYPFYYPGYFNIPYIIGYNLKSITWAEGAIGVDIIERSNQKIIWRGWTEENEFNPGYLTHQIRHKVSAIFSRMPVNVSYE